MYVAEFEGYLERFRANCRRATLDQLGTALMNLRLPGRAIAPERRGLTERQKHAMRKAVIEERKRRESVRRLI